MSKIFDQETYDKAFTDISNVVNTFLKEQGGFSNGYETYISGHVCLNSHSKLKWRTPKREKLTGEKVDRLGRELYSSVLSIIENYKIEEVKISKCHLEYGCFRIDLNFPNTRRIDLLFRP